MYRNMMRTVLVLITFTSSFLNAFGQRIVLGVLEDNPGHYVGEPNFRTVRAVFRKEGSDWRPFRSDCADQTCLKDVTSTYPNEVTWNIAFDGKDLGQVTTRTPKDFAWYADVGQQEIPSKVTVPTMGKRSSEFGGFSDAAVYRPLIANSQPYFKDPDTWKSVTVASEFTAALQQEFRKKFPKLCRLSQADSSTLELLPYRNEEVKIVKAYASKTGWLVAHLHLEAIDCQDVEAGFNIDDPWFVVDPKKSIRYLDSGMWLVDAGDYDNDGRSELVFSINRYNRGGYELFYDDFKQHALFEFSYH